MTQQFAISHSTSAGGRRAYWSNDRLPCGLTTDFVVTRYAGTESEETLTATVYECVGEVDESGQKIPNTPTIFTAEIRGSQGNSVYHGLTSIDSAFAHALLCAGGGEGLVWRSRIYGLDHE